MATPSRTSPSGIAPVGASSPTSPPPDGVKGSNTATRAFSRTPSSWDPQDDLLLRHLKEQQKLGWKEIAAHFAHRTPNACQFRWRRLRSGVLKNANVNPAASPGLSAAQLPSVSANNISNVGTGTPSSGGISKRSSVSSASGNSNANSNVTGALAGLNALSSGIRTASPAPLGSQYSQLSTDEKFLNGGGNGGASLFSSIVNPLNNNNKSRSSQSGMPITNSNANSNGASFVGAPNYAQWSFSSNNNGVGSPDNDPLSNSISSLTSLDSTASNKNSFNLYNQDNHINSQYGSGINGYSNPNALLSSSNPLPASASGSFSQQSFSQGFMLSYNEQWRPDEDELLLSKRRRELSLTELSILLPTRSEEDIIARIKELDQQPQNYRSSLRANSATTSIYGDSDLHSEAATASGAAAGSGNQGIAGRESRLNSTSNGYGLHTLSRTLSASSQISLNSNTSSFSYLNHNNTGSNNHSNSNNTLTSSNNNNNNNSTITSQLSEATPATNKGTIHVTPAAASLNLLNASNNSSPLPSSKSSPLISSRQIPVAPGDYASGSSTPLTTGVTAAPASSVSGGMNISSLRRTLSQTSSGSRTNLTLNKSNSIFGTSNNNNNSSNNVNQSSNGSLNSMDTVNSNTTLVLNVGSNNNASTTNPSGKESVDLSELNAGSNDSIVTDEDDLKDGDNDTVLKDLPK